MININKKYMNVDNQELYDNICKADIQNSLSIATKLILKDPQKSFISLQNIFINVCAYIGAFVTIYEIRMWIDVIESVMSFIDDEQVVIKNLYVLIAKMCILCLNYNKKPSIKTGVLSVKLIREKVIDMFADDNFKLTQSGISKFEGIIPPHDSPSYQLSIQIITGYVNILKKVSDMSVDSDADKLFDISQKIRHSFDYVTRKKYTFETTFYENDNDAVWFLWGLISLLYDDNEIDIVYKLYTFDFKKTMKKNRIGLLWGAAVVMVYLNKKDIARNWNREEVMMITKIYDLSMDLYKDIKKEFKEEEELQTENSNDYHDGLGGTPGTFVYGANRGLDYITKYRPTIDHSSSSRQEENPTNDERPTIIKSIKYKRRFYN